MSNLEKTDAKIFGVLCCAHFRFQVLLFAEKNSFPPRVLLAHPLGPANKNEKRLAIMLPTTDNRDMDVEDDLIIAENSIKQR